jgi:hypothetical protein
MCRRHLTIRKHIPQASGTDASSPTPPTQTPLPARKLAAATGAPVSGSRGGGERVIINHSNLGDHTASSSMAYETCITSCRFQLAICTQHPNILFFRARRGVGGNGVRAQGAENAFVCVRARVHQASIPERVPLPSLFPAAAAAATEIHQFSQNHLTNKHTHARTHVLSLTHADLKLLQLLKFELLLL